MQSGRTQVDQARTRTLRDVAAGVGPVVYWMQRDQRSVDNWALLYAQEMAIERNVPLQVVFTLVETYGTASFRQFAFMLRGLKEVEQDLLAKNIQFTLLEGRPEETVVRYVNEVSAGELVVDFNPMPLPRAWKAAALSQLRLRVTEVDAHNIVPCFVASDKEEFAAYTFRPKVQRVLQRYLTTFPILQTHQYGETQGSGIDWEMVIAGVSADRDIPEINWCASGMKAATSALQDFLTEGLETYAKDRNDPTKTGQSNLSPYLHFGQLAAQRVAYEVNQAYGIDKESREAYLEELVVRKELADNYCQYSSTPDTVAGAHEWAKKTIAEHKDDVREYLYTKAQFTAGETHDELWNAMQAQLVTTGKLHGWCRMYWAKKILEWTTSAEEAIEIALCLNDTFSIDGNDPNGIVGVMWSICGVHDRAWSERPIFGKIRYMNLAGAKRKFKVDAYIEKWRPTKHGLFND